MQLFGLTQLGRGSAPAESVSHKTVNGAEMVHGPGVGKKRGEG